MDSAPVRHILLVDDDSLLLGSYCKRLRSAGWLVAAARSLSEAAARLRGELPDLAVVDLYLGEESGLDLVRALRSRAPGLPIVVVSGMLSTQCVVAAVRAGATNVVSKLDGLDAILAAGLAPPAVAPVPAPVPARLDSLANVTNQHVVSVFERCHGSQRATARVLGVSLSTVRRWLIDLGLIEGPDDTKDGDRDDAD
ncbi:MAG: response regulator [Deltaproteobacteria bacterium]|nr:response regulator [Deltaproteobacteria bacterium]